MLYMLNHDFPCQLFLQGIHNYVTLDNKPHLEKLTLSQQVLSTQHPL